MKPENADLGKLITGPSMFSRKGDLTLAAGQHLVMETALRKMKEDGETVSGLMEASGVSWVILSMTIRYVRHTHPEESLSASCCAASRRGCIFRTDLVLKNERMEPALEAALFFGIMDIGKRKLVREGNILDRIFCEGGTEAFEAGSRIRPDLSGFRAVHARHVYPSWLDELGHVNNLRYGEMVYDAMTAADRNSVGALKSYEMYFLHELHEGDTVNILTKRNLDSTETAGVSEKEGVPCFFSRCVFDSLPCEK